MLSLDNPANTSAYSGQINGFTEGDAIYLPDVTYSSSDFVIFEPSNSSVGGGSLEVKLVINNFAVITLAGLIRMTAAPPRRRPS